MSDHFIRLDWRPTWLETDNDFVAIDPRMATGIVGRIYILTAGPSKNQWALTASERMVKRPSEHRDYCTSARNAVAKVETALFKAVEHIPQDVSKGNIR